MLWHDSIMCCDMTHWCVVMWLIDTFWHDTSICCDVTHWCVVRWLIDILWHDTLICCDMTHWYFATWLIDMLWRNALICCDVTHWYVVTCVSHNLEHQCSMTPSYASDSLICCGVTHCYDVTWLIDMLWHDTLICYGVATISMLLQIIGLFCKRALQKRLYSAKETYNFKEPANRSHPIWYTALICCNRTRWCVVTWRIDTLCYNSLICRDMCVT